MYVTSSAKAHPPPRNMYSDNRDEEDMCSVDNWKEVFYCQVVMHQGDVGAHHFEACVDFTQNLLSFEVRPLNRTISAFCVQAPDLETIFEHRHEPRQVVLKLKHSTKRWHYMFYTEGDKNDFRNRVDHLIDLYWHIVKENKEATDEAAGLMDLLNFRS